MKMSDVQYLEHEVQKAAVTIAYVELRKLIGEAAQQLSNCSCCGEPTEIAKLAGCTGNLYALLAEMVKAILTDEESSDPDFTVDLEKVFGSVKGLKEFRAVDLYAEEEAMWDEMHEEFLAREAEALQHH